jgi:hypothetical protein
MTRPVLVQWMLIAAAVLACAAPSREVREGPSPGVDAEAQSWPAPADPDVAPSRVSPTATSPGAAGAPPPEEDAPPDRRVRAAVNALASAGLGEARPARFLEALSHALEQLPGASLAEGELERLSGRSEAATGAGSHRLGSRGSREGRIRSRARRVHVHRERHAGRETRWIPRGRNQAVRRLDGRTPLGLQRTELQDAGRALADAVLVALEFGKACPEPGTSPP